MPQPDNTETVRLTNGVDVDILTAGEHFLGLGAIRGADGTLLRSGRRPMFVEIRTPDALLLSDYKLRSRKVDPNGITIELSVSGKPDGIEEWMIHEIRNRFRTSDWTEDAQPLDDVVLTLTVKPLQRTIGGRIYDGLVYQYLYSGESHPLYKIRDRSTWELGGHAIGNEFWMRNCFVPCIVPIESVDQFHSTEWYLPTTTNPNIFQFLPLQTELQGFSFTAADAGTLITWPNRVAHVRSLFEKPRGKNEIVHWHEQCGDLSGQFETAPMEVLFCAGATDRTGRFNDYEAVKELVHETLHGELGMRRERVNTYGQSEEWILPDMPRYTQLGLPKLLDAGAKTIYVANHFENNMNTYGVTNMCCTVDYKFAETVGEENIRDYCEVAHQAGAKVEMWANTSLSSITSITAQPNSKKQRIDFLPFEGSVMDVFKDAPHAFVRNASGAIEADHYAPSFCVMNLREPVVRQYWLKRWKEACEIGLDGIFLDSSFNLSSDKFHWVANRDAESSGATADQTHLLGFYRPPSPAPSAILSQYRAHLDLMTEMQGIGYNYCNEDVGVFGTHRHGPGVDARLDTLPLWTDCIATYDVPALNKAGVDLNDIFFRGLAYRMMWSLHWDCPSDKLSWNYGGFRGDFDTPTDWQISLLKAYNEIEPLLQKREILPGETAVVYTAGEKRILWAFQDLDFSVDRPTSVRDVLSGETQTTAQLSASARRIYVIG